MIQFLLLLVSSCANCILALLCFKQVIRPFVPCPVPVNSKTTSLFHARKLIAFVSTFLHRNNPVGLVIRLQCWEMEQNTNMLLRKMLNQ